MQDLSTLWIGGDLGAMERASLNSMMRLGHDVTLYSYTPIKNAPYGIRLRDASEIMPADRILLYRDKRKPSPALHANLFRYAMLNMTDAAWVDLDIVAVRPVPHADYLMGFETSSSVNNAVLRLPHSSPTLKQLLSFTSESRGVPPHIQGARRIKYWVRTLGRGYPIESWAWGSTGPKALTMFLAQNSELHNALPKNVFYPIGVHDHDQFLEPGRWQLNDFPSETICLHLWGSRIRKTLAERYNGQVPRGSLYAEILDTFADLGQ